MRRWIAILWHASFLVLAGGLYFFFVLPRWYELLGQWSPTLGTAMRVVCGVLIAAAALPVLFTWLRSRKPEYGTPALALRLRVLSIVLQVLAGVLVVGAAISEIWLSLDDAGRWLFAVYGAAAALTLLGALSFYLAYAAELPPPPPRPLKPKKRTRRRGRTATEVDGVTEAAEVTETAEATESAELAGDDAAEAVEGDEPPAAAVTNASTDGSDETPADAVPADDADETPAGNADAAADDEPTDESAGRLRNRRPAGKSSSRLFRRNRGGVALDD